MKTKVEAAKKAYEDSTKATGAKFRAVKGTERGTRQTGAGIQGKRDSNRKDGDCSCKSDHKDERIKSITRRDGI